jgi:LPS export ABC transporter protein LptC
MERIEEAKIQTRKRVKLLDTRAKMPRVFRLLAIVAIAATVLLIGINFYRASGNREFRMIPGLAELSKDVVAVVNGYERREAEGEKLKYFVKADKATTFSDNHQELENAYFEIYDETGTKFDKLQAVKAVYIPAGDKKFNAYLFGKVDATTRDGLNLKTEQIAYNSEADTITADELVEFSRENITGKSLGATAKVKEKFLELRKDVEIISNPVTDPAKTAEAKVQSGKMTAGRAVYDQTNNQVLLEQNVFISVVPLNDPENFSQPTDLKAEKATAFFENQEIKKIDLNQNVEIYAKPTASNAKSMKAQGNTATAIFEKELSRLEMNENVYIETTNSDAKPTKIRAQNAVYEKPVDKFDLKNNVEIITVEDEKPTIIHSNQAIYEQTNGRVFLNGNAEITQGNDLLKGDNIEAQLFPNKKLQTGFSRGNAYLKQNAPDRVTETTGNEINVFYGGNQQLERANVVSSANVSITPNQGQGYSKATINAPNAMRLLFRSNGYEGVLNEVQTDGRTTIVMNPATGNPKSAFRKITADTVKTNLNQNGKDLMKAEAVGNAEMYVEPTQVAPENYKTTVTAPRFDCDFYEGNNARVCTATTKGKAVMVPMVPAENRGTRTISADKLITNFNQNTQDVEQFDAIDNAKFTELDRNGISSRMTYTAQDETVRLRGNDPTVWDSRARARAVEIDWDTKNQKSYLRGKVSTTYYSQKQTNGSTPFGKSDAPVYVTSNDGQFDHQNQVAVYTGNARAWQENNYVRAEKLILQDKSKRMDGEGKVQSLLYNTRQKAGSKVSNQPVYAASDRMAYTDGNKQLHYESNVDIRQGTDRILSGVADVFLDENNEAKQTVVQNNVVITQPNRKATGTWAQHTSADDVVVLKGNPATVADAESGTSQGSQFTFLMREDRVINQGTTKPNATGRTRSVYKVKP